jgi:PQQ-like domain
MMLRSAYMRGARAALVVLALAVTGLDQSHAAALGTASQTVYVGSDDGNLYALNAQTG